MHDRINVSSFHLFQCYVCEYIYFFYVVVKQLFVDFVLNKKNGCFYVQSSETVLVSGHSLHKSFIFSVPSQRVRGL